MRVADVGGWTDTWFASDGAVTNVAVGPGTWAEVRVGSAAPSPVVIVAPDVVAGRHVVDLGATPPDGPVALLAHAVQAWAEALAPGALGPDGVSVELTVGSAVPPGSSLGTSASVLVAVLAALHGASGSELAPGPLARSAHLVETERAGRQSGVQDHVAAAFGGVSRLTVTYPHVERDQVRISPDLEGALRRSLLTVHLGSAHDSSALHRSVIARAEAGEAHVAAVLAALAAEARRAATALEAGDLAGWAATLSAATALQARLDAGLVPDRIRHLVEVAAESGAQGAKVNGAGGAGGTVTIVVEPSRRAAVLAAVRAVEPMARELPLVPTGGVRLIAGG